MRGAEKKWKIRVCKPSCLQGDRLGHGREGRCEQGHICRWNSASEPCLNIHSRRRRGEEWEGDNDICFQSIVLEAAEGSNDTLLFFEYLHISGFTIH